MNLDELKDLAEVLTAIADGAEWECKWSADGWGDPLGRDVLYCVKSHIPIRIKPGQEPQHHPEPISLHDDADFLDKCAMAALQGIMASTQHFDENGEMFSFSVTWHEYVAMHAYEAAQAMLKVRKGELQ
jgi:hypothetical protein